jgi:hypothetical protein
MRHGQSPLQEFTFTEILQHKEKFLPVKLSAKSQRLQHMGIKLPSSTNQNYSNLLNGLNLCRYYNQKSLCKLTAELWTLLKNVILLYYNQTASLQNRCYSSYSIQYQRILDSSDLPPVRLITRFRIKGVTSFPLIPQSLASFTAVLMAFSISEPKINKPLKQASYMKKKKNLL